jgi:hypothetical protein
MTRARTTITRAIESGRGRAPFLIGLAALVFIPLGLLDALEESLGPIDTGRLDDLELLGAIAGTAIHSASALLGEILYTGAVAVAVISTPAGANPSMRELVRQTRWRTLIAIDLLFVLGMLTGLLLLVIPGLIFFARYVLVAVIAEVEALGVRESFRRSAELTRGARRLVLGVLFAAFLAGDLATQALKAAAAELGGDHFLVDWVAASGGEILLNPVIALHSVALALELGARPAHPHPDAVAA